MLIKKNAIGALMRSAGLQINPDCYPEIDRQLESRLQAIAAKAVVNDVKRLQLRDITENGAKNAVDGPTSDVQDNHTEYAVKPCNRCGLVNDAVLRHATDTMRMIEDGALYLLKEKGLV